MAAEITGLAILRGQLDRLVQSRKRLIRLISRQLDGRDVHADLGIGRFQFQGSEILRQRLVGSPFGFEQSAQRKVPSGALGVDLDGGRNVLERRRDLALLGLDLSQADQRLDIIGVALQRRTETSFGFGKPPLEL